jgi:hypothetical protein
MNKNSYILSIQCKYILSVLYNVINKITLLKDIRIGESGLSI